MPPYNDDMLCHLEKSHAGASSACSVKIISMTLRQGIVLYFLCTGWRSFWGKPKRTSSWSSNVTTTSHYYQESCCGVVVVGFVCSWWRLLTPCSSHFKINCKEFQQPWCWCVDTDSKVLVENWQLWGKYHMADVTFTYIYDEWAEQQQETPCS